MCMSLPGDEVQPVFRVHGAVDKPQVLLRVLASALLAAYQKRKEEVKSRIVSLEIHSNKKAG